MAILKPSEGNLPKDNDCNNQTGHCETVDTMAAMEQQSISEFFADKSVFITGGSGFVGKVLVEKLLRSCPEIKNIYLLLRVKKGQDARQRLEQLTSSPLFARLKKGNPSVLHKVLAVQGDITLPALGLSPEDTEMLIRNVNLVFHSAATVRFDQPLKQAIEINLMGTRKVIDLCRRMKNILAFIHVSTAYANCIKPTIDEMVYPPPCDPDKLISAAEWMDEKLLDTIAPHLMQEWPNTYTYTKCLTEALVQEEAGSIPTTIIRPSIVSPTWREPLPGWTDNMNGPIGLVAAGTKGILRTMVADEHSANMIPADTVINLMIAAAWHTATYRPNTAIVYHGTAENDKTLTWAQYVSLCCKIILKYPSAEIFCCPGGTTKPSVFVNSICTFFLHTIPAAFADTLLYITGRKPRMLKIYSKLHRALDCLAYFIGNQWTFDKTNVYALEKTLSEKDRETFNFSIRQLHLSTYWEDCVLGTRRYILKEDYSTLPLARKKMNRAYLVNQLINIALLVGFYRIFIHQSEVINTIFSYLTSAINFLVFGAQNPSLL